MYFESFKQWEVDTGTVGQAFGGPEKRSYPLIELSHNFHLLMLDVVVGDEGENVTSRFMFGSVDDLFQFINQNNLTDFRISLLSRRCDNDGEYCVSDIKEIQKAKDKTDQSAHIYICIDGNKYIDSLVGDSDSDLEEIESIYFDNKASVDSKSR